MTLRPVDMLEIQTAIDEYERKFPRRPAPTAEVALAWRLGKKEWAKRQAAQRSAEGRDAMFAQQECNRLEWAGEQLRLRLPTWRLSLDLSEPFEDSIPWLRGLLRLGLWGVVAVLIVSIFFFGAIVGGFK